jgi:hypothetical protein
MKTLRRAVLFAAMLVLATAGGALGGGPLEDVNIRQPLDMFVWVPCADDGNGEVVHLTGELHVLLQATVDANGGLHITSHDQPMGVSGVGLTTGAAYRGTGVTRDHTTSLNGGAPYLYTYVNNFRIVGQGRGNNFLVHQTVHITINANDEVTAQFDHSSAECK